MVKIMRRCSQIVDGICLHRQIRSRRRIQIAASPATAGSISLSRNGGGLSASDLASTPHSHQALTVSALLRLNSPSASPEDNPQTRDIAAEADAAMSWLSRASRQAKHKEPISKLLHSPVSVESDDGAYGGQRTALAEPSAQKAAKAFQRPQESLGASLLRLVADSDFGEGANSLDASPLKASPVLSREALVAHSADQDKRQGSDAELFQNFSVSECEFPRRSPTISPFVTPTDTRKVSQSLTNATRTAAAIQHGRDQFRESFEAAGATRARGPGGGDCRTSGLLGANSGNVMQGHPKSPGLGSRRYASDLHDSEDVERHL